MKGIGMELRTLQYFLTAANEENISRAAEILHVSQPAVSKQIKDLERELGVNLFVRQNRKVILTEKGKYLQDKATRLLNFSESIRQEISGKTSLVGKIAIGAGESPAIRTLAKVIKNVQQKEPGLQFQLSTLNADQVMKDLDYGLLDFGVVLDPVNTEKYHFLSLPHQDLWGLMLNKNHHLANKTTITPRDLKDESLVISSQQGVENLLQQWINDSNVNYKISATYTLLFNASLLVEQNIGAAVCLNGIINLKGTNLKFIPFLPKLQATAKMIWPRSRKLSQAASYFLDIANTLTTKF